MKAPPARELGGRYRLGRLLGRGGMAEVYEAHDNRLERAVAVKLLRPDMAAHPEVRSRFEVEARSAARLSHPNVVAVYDTGEHDGEPYLVMELLPGETLADRIAAGPMDPGEVRRVAGDVLAALAAAHAAGLIHRDVKPANVLITPDGRAKVADFGIAKSVEIVAGDVTATGLLLGTPAYLAPERIDGEPATVRSDLYSVAVMLYEALAGAKPFPGTSPVAVASAVRSSEPPSLHDARPGLDPALVAAVERGMARDPADRPASAEAMAAELLLEPADTVALGTLPPPISADETMVASPAAFGGGAGPAVATAPPRAALADRLPSDPVARRRLLAALAAAVVVVFLILVLASGRGDSQDTGNAQMQTASLAERIRGVAERVETGDGPRGPDAAERLEKVADQVEAGGGGDAATDLLRDATAWSSEGGLSPAALSAMAEVLGQIPGVDLSVTTTTLAPTTAPPVLDEDDLEELREERKERGKGRGRGED